MRLRKIEKQDKKGFLLAEQVVKIVIALIALGFLVYFLSSLYFSKIALEKQKKAQSILSTGGDTLQKHITSLSAGAQDTFLLISPTGWYLFSFTGDKEKPRACEKKNCLCICDNVADIWGRQLKYCNEQGSCIIVEDLKEYENELEILISANPPTELNIKKDSNGKIEVQKA